MNKQAKPPMLVAGYGLGCDSLMHLLLKTAPHDLQITMSSKYFKNLEIFLYTKNKDIN